MKTLYLDIFSGISGDMFVGALIDLGADSRKLERELEKLTLKGYHLHSARAEKSGISGIKFNVHLEHDHHDDHSQEHAHGHKHAHTHSTKHSHAETRIYGQIRKLINQSRLSVWVKEKSVAVFHRIAVAEGRIHGLPPEQVHFHEVGAIDSIVDIVGACIALEMLGKPRVLSGPVVDGTGFIDCAHGRLPLPAPATLAILGARGIAVTQCDEPHELVTPTGAALLAEFAESFGPMQGLIAEKTGFGLGTRDNRTRVNVLRAILGSAPKVQNPKPKAAAAVELDWETDTIVVPETNLDDINAEILGHFVDTALAAGALDVFHTPIQMKKNRPGVLLTVLCTEAEADKFTELLLRETSAFGVRRSFSERRKLRREFAPVKTPYGPVTIKLGRLNGKVVQVAPEFESCKKAAAKSKVPLKAVYEAAVKAIKL